MSSILQALSDELAHAVQVVAPSVVQVLGPRRAAAGVVIGPDLVVTSSRGLDAGAASVRSADGTVAEGIVLGRGRLTGLAVVGVAGLGSPAASAAPQPRPGHLAQAVGRTWSGGVMAALAPVVVVGGPLRTGRTTEIPTVVRIGLAPHGALSGGALVDGDGRVLGIVTPVAIRGTTVVVPAEYAWSDAHDVVATGGAKQGYLGVGSMPVSLAPPQQGGGHTTGLLVTSVAAGGPAEAAGVVVGDIIVRFEGAPMADPEALVARLTTTSVGAGIRLGLVRGVETLELAVTVGERRRG